MTSVLVAGAAGGIGEGVVRALLRRAGVRVFATSRDPARLDALTAGLDADVRSRVTPIAGNAGDFAGATQIAEQIASLGGADAAVASLGRGDWTSGPTLALAPAEWTAVLDEMLTAHFAFARAIVPLLAVRSGSVYLSLGGGAAFAPMPNAGLMSVAAAGQAMLTRVLARERGDAPPRIIELVVNGAITTRAERDDVGEVVAELVLHGATTWTALRVDGALLTMDEKAAAPGAGEPD